MHKRVLTFIASILMTIDASALDIRVGKGDFTATQGMDGLYTVSAEIDLDVLSLNEQHYGLGKSGLYLFGGLDIYSSKQADSVTNVIDTIMNTSTPTLPFDTPIAIPTTTPNDVLGTFIPVPSSYKVHGVDFDIGVGYDVIHEKRGYLGVGVMTGISTPAMEMENYFEALNFYTKLLEQTKTDMTTYKLGLTLQGGLNMTDYLGLYATGTYAYQFGEIENSIVRSSMDAKGTYQAFDLGLKFHPLKLSEHYKETLWSRLYLNIGHSYKKWEVDQMQATIIGIDTPDVFTSFDLGFESSYTYFGLGYSF